jgi:hypothetical protein
MRNEYSDKFQERCKQIAKDLLDRNLFIRAGCKALLDLKLPQDRDEALRYAFFAGADHVFTTLSMVMDGDREVTPADLRYALSIQDELDGWRKIALALLEDSPKGTA